MISMMPETDGDMLRTLARWFDVDDAKKGNTGSEVQDDLRRIAKRLDEMDAGKKPKRKVKK